ncbi:MAG: glycosyltransferase [Lachnospiraceae bacterium]|nr:glycosyltransferase [Lachnospiraceae bacterium]
MNICLLNDSFPPVIDGVANTVVNYADIIQKRDDSRVIVATPRYPDADYTGHPYKVLDYPSLDTSRFISGYRAGYSLSGSLINELSEFGPDIIHTHCPASSTLLARTLQYETGAPVVFTYHTKFDVDITRAVGDGFLKKETIKAMVSNISACDEVWVVSEGAGENLRSLGFEGNYQVMLNGVDFERGCSSKEQVYEAVKDYDLPAGIPVFLFVGRIMEYKGIPVIVDCMKLLARDGMDFRMMFVGGGLDLEKIKASVEEGGISDKVIFTGPIHDREVLRAINTRADIFLFPSTYDTNGIVVREAAACGLASVLIRDSCAAEGITHARNGYIIDNSPEAMAALLKEVCNDMDAVHEVGQKAMDEIYLSWEDSVARAYNRYEIIREMLEDGLLIKRRKHKSDYLIQTAAEVAERLNKIISVPRNIHSTIHGNITRLYEGMMQNDE